MTIPAIGALGVSPTSGPWSVLGGVLGAPGTTSVPAATSVGSDAASAASGAAFGSSLTQAVDALQATQSKADNLAVQAATGDLQDVHDYTIAATEASLATELTVALRNKAVESFNDIMRMPV